MRIAPTSRFFIIMLSGMAAMAPFATDLGLPALHYIADGLHTTESLSGLTISLFMAGFAFMPLIYGPLSDRYGRKPILIGGLSVFTLASIACTFSPNITALLVARTLQGAGASAGITMAFAVVRDCFSGQAARTRLSMLAAILNCAPIISPSVGALLVSVGNWRFVYALLMVIGIAVITTVALGYGESRPQGAQAPRGALAARYRAFFGNRASLCHVLLYGFGFGAAFAYISGSSLVLIGAYHVSTLTYGGLFACTAMGIVGGASTNGALSARGITHLPMLPMGLAGLVIVTLVLVLLSATVSMPLPLLVALFVCTTFSFGTIAPNATHGALEPVPEAAGVVSGMLASFQMICAASASALVSFLFPRFGLLGMTSVMLAYAVCSACAYLASRRGRRTHPVTT